MDQSHLIKIISAKRAQDFSDTAADLRLMTTALQGRKPGSEESKSELLWHPQTPATHWSLQILLLDKDAELTFHLSLY